MRVVTRLLPVLVLLLLGGCASGASPGSDMGPATVASARALDAESAARLVAEGGALYADDNPRRNGYDYCSRASSLIERGDLRLGIREASKALFLGQTGTDRCLIAYAKRDLATAYLFAGNLERAREYAQGAISDASGCRNAASVSGPAQKVLGDALLREGKLTEAINLYKSLPSGTGQRAQMTALALGNAYIAGSNFREAAEQLARAKTAVRNNQTLAVMVERALGQLALAEGRHGEAASLFEQAARSASGTDAAYHRLWALDGLARARLAAGDQPGAVAAYREAMATAEQVRVRFRSEEFRTGFFGEIQSIFDRALALLFETGDAQAAFGVSEHSRARALDDLIRGRVTATAQGQVVAEATGPAAATSDLRAALQPGTVVVAYHITDRRVFAWVVRPDTIRAVAADVGRESLAAQVGAFRDYIRARDPRADEVGAQLYRILVTPLELGRDERVIVIPHGSLHYLPFQALRGPAGYFIEERIVSYAPSASTLRALLSKTPGPPHRVLALGNPDIGDPRLALPGAEREVRHLKTRFPDAEMYVLKDATKARFLAAGPGSDLVHIGAHADVDEVDPLYSTIYLASADRRSGVLEAHELYSMKFGHSPVVALSACNTGLGRVARGDEILGFTRTFLASGARTLLVTLWPVEDRATAQLMERFYDGLESGAAQAIRLAELELVRQEATKHPFFWASFDLVGDPR